MYPTRTLGATVGWDHTAPWRSASVRTIVEDMRRLALGLAILPLLAPLACDEAGSDGLDGGMDGDAGPPLVWQKVGDLPSNEDFMGIWGRSRRDPETMLEAELEIFVVGFGGTILRYDGTTWSKETTTSTQPLTAISGTGLPDPTNPRADPKLTFAVGWNGTILERSPAGTWAPLTNTPTSSEDLFDVTMANNESGMIVGDNGRVLVFDDPGAGPVQWRINRFAVRGEFSNMLIDPKASLKAVWTNGNTYYMVGAGGAAFRSTNGPRNYEALDTLISDPLVGVWGPGGDNVFAVGLDSLLLNFSGGQWRRVNLEGLPRVFLMDADGQGGDITVVGWRGTVLRRGPDGYFAERTDINTDLRGIWIDPITEVAWAVGASGTILRRDPPPPPDAGIP
jgi:photosystem II stability/assembly factor-like uncharacterized protein